MLRDRHRLRRWWVRLCKSDPNAPRATAAHHEPVAANVDAADPPSGSVIAFQHALQHSQQVYERRRASMPQPIFDQELPVLAHRDAIIKAIQTHPVTVICGETGSGKSTQLPQICIAAGFGIAGVIGHTQPRRIAARSIAERLAVELHTTFGKDVGFKIRFTDKTDADTKIKLMTDGILLAETQGDRYLNEYEVIILDEAHERSLNIDFLLGYFHQLLPKRPDLRLIITSATIDAERFAEHFSSDQRLVPILQVSGRSYPVEVRYRSPQEFDVETSNSSANDTEEQQTVRGIVAALHELSAIDRGDILVFLPTERDIRELAKRLRGEQFAGDGIQRTEILPLYARLSTAEQNRIFQPHAYRRIVLATNVAESSLTVPGIRY
ncbi:MAG: ATP-dependent RNA helicase HrpA, partial [Planctomycetales bacterium]|nr:ATP-dependent RNA helicase HrpA [Planctomycetales bacterium]